MEAACLLDTDTMAGAPSIIDRHGCPWERRNLHGLWTRMQLAPIIRIQAAVLV